MQQQIIINHILKHVIHENSVILEFEYYNHISKFQLFVNKKLLYGNDKTKYIKLNF